MKRLAHIYPKITKMPFHRDVSRHRVGAQIIWSKSHMTDAAIVFLRPPTSEGTHLSAGCNSA